MSVVKFISLVESASPGPKGDSAALADQIGTTWAAMADELPVAGLIVGEIVEPITDGPAVVVTIQWWAEESSVVDPVRALLDGVGDPTAFLVTSWQLREHVYRRPVERLQEGSDRERLNLFGTAHRRADFDHEAFFRYWDDVHAPISSQVPGLGGYVASEVLQRRSGALEADGFIELWWPDRDTYEASGDTPQQAAAWQDVGNYAATTGAFWLTREHVLLAPPDTAPGTQDSRDA